MDAKSQRRNIEKKIVKSHSDEKLQRIFYTNVHNMGAARYFQFCLPPQIWTDDAKS